MRRRVRSGQWRRCSPGVYFADDRPFTAAARIRAAVWSRGSHAVASGRAAAWWLGLTADAPGCVEITVPRSSHGRAAAGTVLRRRDLADADIIDHRDIRVTAIPLTTIEAAVHDAAIMDTALRNRVGLADLQRAHLRNRNRAGAKAAGRLLAAATGGARSEAERLALHLLRSAGITGWHANFAFGPYIIDIAFPEQRVAVEIDGWAFHTDHRTFQSDRVRQNRLTLHGWQVLRFTWLDLTKQPERVLAQIQAAILAR